MYFGLRVSATIVLCPGGSTTLDDFLALLFQTIPPYTGGVGWSGMAFVIRLTELGWIGWRFVLDRQG